MKTTLSKTEFGELLPKIQQVIETGKSWEDENLHYPAGAAIDAILTITGVTKKQTDEGDEDFDTNGWQWDWRQHFRHGGKDYTLSGSGYYGGLRFNLSDE